MAVRHFFRRWFRGGNTATVFFGEDPKLDPNEAPRVMEGDIFIDRQLSRIYVFESGTWVQKNHWNELDGKPLEFRPQQHALSGDRHSGRLPITKVSGHTLKNSVHIRAITMASALGRIGPIVLNQPI